VLFLQKLRWAVRFTAASLFWVHALAFIQVHLPRPPLYRWGAAVNLTHAETNVVLALLLLSVLASYGVSKFVIDLLYIYCFPLIVPCYVTLIAIRVVKLFRRLQKPSPTPPRVPASAAVIDVPALVKIEKPKSEPRWRRFLLDATRPLRQFTLLWCLLLLLSSSRALLSLALVIVSCHLLSALVRLFGFTMFFNRYFVQGQSKARAYVEELLSAFLAIPEGGDLTEQMKQEVHKLMAIKLCLSFFQNRSRVNRLVLGLGAAVYAGLYLYLALLFGFLYFGIAKVQGIQLSWVEALITSTVIPFAYTDLPRNAWLKAVGGVHCFVALAVGLSAVFGYLRKKLEAFHEMAAFLNDRLEDRQVKLHLEVLSERVKAPSTPGAPAPGRT